MDQVRALEKPEIKSDPARALWYALKVKDYELASYLVETGA
jgi:hypothetical protein